MFSYKNAKFNHAIDKGVITFNNKQVFEIVNSDIAYCGFSKALGLTSTIELFQNATILYY